jgi:hypothetical protein
MPVKTCIQHILKILDSRLRGKDGIRANDSIFSIAKQAGLLFEIDKINA